MATKSMEKVLKEKEIREVINPRLVQGPPSLSLEEAVLQMRDERSSYLVIAKGKKLLGIFTENDLVFKILGKTVDWTKPVTDFMTKDPMALKLTSSVGEAIDLMSKHRFYHIPLVNDQNELAGILSVRTLIRFLAEFYPTEIFNLPPKVDQVMQAPEGG